MVLDEVTKYFHHGRFEDAIDLIDDRLTIVDIGSTEFIELTKLKSRLYYHQGRGDQALYFINQVEKYCTDLETRTGRAIYLYGQGKIVEAKSIINSLTVDELHEKESSSENSISSYTGLSNYHYSLGLFAEFEGDLQLAHREYEKALDYRETIDDRYEINIIYYKLATIYRQLGELEKTRKYLIKTLQLSKELDLTKEIATSSTLIGQDLLMQTEYDEAVPYLEQGVFRWEEQGSPFGMIWALGELAIVAFLTENSTTAIQYYDRIIKEAEDIMPPMYYSNHLLNAIRFSIRAGEIEKARDYSDQLEQIAEKTNNSNIVQRAEMGRILVDKQSNRIGKRLQQRETLSKLSKNAKETLLSYEAILEDIDLLLLEYRITELETVKKEILDEADEILDELLRQIQFKMNITFELHAAVIRTRIEKLRIDPKEIAEIVNNIKANYDEIDISSITKRFDEITSNDDPLWMRDQKFDFDKELQSIPTLKILLYLLPRTHVSFSELQKETELSAGHLSGKCAKLEEVDYIIKEKRFENENLVTIFSLTPKGYIRLKDYLNKLSNYFRQFF